MRCAKRVCGKNNIKNQIVRCRVGDPRTRQGNEAAVDAGPWGGAAKSFIRSMGRSFRTKAATPAVGAVPSSVHRQRVNAASAMETFGLSQTRGL
ncbi:hypothetical protein EVAR_63692_1 [Eumeta japonica]|uniref:Uncharacterized protein n=1 Tax=Eumeta variegata TaxID=151549 RepID=A0A4C1ZAR9_EUMVA|nr:hypothetical protein EVAR_63692_1 [Eumeta japonica]